MLYARVGDRVYIHGSTKSRAVRLLAEGAPACLTVTLVHGLVLARSAFEHSANYDSVMAFGPFARVLDEDERLRAFEAFTEKLLPGRWDEGRQPNAKELKATEILALEIGDASVKAPSGRSTSPSAGAGGAAGPRPARCRRETARRRSHSRRLRSAASGSAHVAARRLAGRCASSGLARGCGPPLPGVLGRTLAVVRRL